MDYQKMYSLLFNRITDAINILQRAQLETEEKFIRGDEPIVRLIPLKEESSEE